MRYLKSPVLLFIFLFSQVTFAQYYDTGEDPASLKWMQIKTDHFTVIYPKSYGSGGISFAKALDEAYLKLNFLFPEKRVKIPVIIHSFSSNSNGYVAWAPRRMEIYPTPKQNSIPLDPHEQLAIHELTHVLQMESLNSGFSKVMSFILGEQAIGAVSSLIPLWYFEGGAVYAESVLTESGRGRIPSFQKQLKAIAVEKGGMYNYDRILNGSYRDYIPNYYQSGYQMVTWALANYDPQIWNKTLFYTGNQPFTLNPVNISLSRSASLTKKQLFKETFDSLGAIWTKDVSKNNDIPYEILNPDKKGKYINYYSPLYVSTDTILAIKTSLSVPPAFVLINPSEKSEKKIHTPGQLDPWFISYGNSKLVWVESQSDHRWENRNYSVIKRMDLNSGKVTRLSRRSRYLAASVSPDGSKIAAIENTINNINNVVFIDTETGTILQSVPSPENVYLQHPQWAEGDEIVTVIALTDKGEGILSYNLNSQQWRTHVESGRADLQSSFLRNDSLFFTSSLSGTENIYLQTPDGYIQALTRSRFGAIDLCLRGEKILFSDYSSIGNNISSTSLDLVSGGVTNYMSSSSFLINRSTIPPQSIENVSDKEYCPEPYRKWQHLFKFHSWMPFYADIEEIKTDPASIRPGVSLMTQNHLSTLISSIGYEYSPEKNHVFHSRITWKGWYPIVESRLDWGNSPKIAKMGESVSDPSEIRPGLSFSNAFYIPFRFSSGAFTEFIRPSFTTDYRNDYIYSSDNETYDYGQTIISGRLYFSNYHRSSVRAIYPRWAQTFDLNYSFAPFDEEIYGSLMSLKTSFYFPGIFPNNGIKIRFEKEKQLPGKYLFGNRVTYPRGYKNINSEKLQLLSADYVLPLAYPDFNISSFLYMKRIRTGFFYDYAVGTGNTYYEQTTSGLVPVTFHNYEERFRSYGFELLADFHVLRIPFMISGGVQTVWKNINENPTFEFLFNIDLFGMTLGKGSI